MKKHENSSVCIKQIMFTTLFLVVATFGGLNAYRIACDEKANTILEIESASADIDGFKTALVENTEEDLIYTRNINFLAAKLIDEPKISSRGSFVREQVANEIISTVTKGEAETKDNENESQTSSQDANQTTNQTLGQTEIQTDSENKLLNTVIKEIKELGVIKKELEKNNEPNLDDSAKINDEPSLEGESKTNDEPSLEGGSKTNVESTLEIVAPTSNQTPPTEYVKTIDVKATAYCLCKKCCGKSPSNPAYGITASGLKITPGQGMKVVASDPKVIPLGTNVYIEGLYGAKDYGYAIVADTGSAIKNLKIDLYMDTHQMALNWGVKSVRVYILDN